MNSTDDGDIDEMYDGYVGLIESGLDLSQFAIFRADRSRFGACLDSMNAVYRQSLYQYGIVDECKNLTWLKIAMKKSYTDGLVAAVPMRAIFVANHISYYKMGDRIIMKNPAGSWNPPEVPPALLQRTWPKLHIGLKEYFVV